MKLWLSGLALLAATSTAQAENFRIVQSPAQKLDIWIDNIKDNTPQSWCKPEVALRIVANGKKDVSVLENFVPRLGALLNTSAAKSINSAGRSTIRREPCWRRARQAKRRTGRWW